MTNNFDESLDKFKKIRKPKKHKRGALIPSDSDVPVKAVDAGPDVKPEDYAHSKRPNKRKKT